VLFFVLENGDIRRAVAAEQPLRLPDGVGVPLMTRSALWMVALFGAYWLQGMTLGTPELKRQTQDLGEIVLFAKDDFTRKMPCEFVFTNDLDESLHVKKLTPSCACTSIEKDVDSVKPGDSIRFSIAVDLGKKRYTQDSALRESVLVELSGPSKQLKLVLELTADVKIRGFPRALDLGPLKDDRYEVVRYFDFGPAPSGYPRLTTVQSSSRMVETWTENHGQQQRVFFRFAMQKMRQGRNAFTLTGVYTLNGTGKAVESIVRVDKVPKVSCPDSVSLGLVTVGEMSEPQVFQVGPGYEGATVDIKSVAFAPQDVLRGAWNRDADGCYWVTVQLYAAKCSGRNSFRGNLHVEFVQGDLKPLDVPVFALLQEPLSGTGTPAAK
jgi:hypothetical protein